MKNIGSGTQQEFWNNATEDITAEVAHDDLCIAHDVKSVRY